MSSYVYKKKPPGHPELSLFSFDLYGLLAQLRQRWPELSSQRIDVWIQTQPSLACIEVRSPLKAIVLHSVLNHPQTPEEVISFILCHELLHLVIPRREVDGRLTAHPPEFWEAERKLFLELDLAWSWLYVVLGLYLRKDKKRECIFVRPGWKSLMNNDRIALEKVAEMCSIPPEAKHDHFL